MALEYRLTVAGNTPVGVVAERALPNLGERPVGMAPLLSADLYERYGFDVTVRAGTNGYFDVEGDQGWWEWQPPAYVSMVFRMDKFADTTWTVTNMLAIVRRVLDTGPEDAALVLNGDVLLLTRFDGALVKHSRDGWWTSYAGANDVLAG